MRPDVQRLISDIETEMIEKVVVYKLDRISRNITDFYKLYEVITQRVKLIISLWKRMQIFYIIELNKLEFDKGV